MLIPYLLRDEIAKGLRRTLMTHKHTRHSSG